MKNSEQNSSFIQKFFENNVYCVVGIFLLIVFLLDYFFIMKRQMDTLNVLNPQVTLLKQDIVETKNNIQKNDVYKAQITRLKEQLQKGGYKIPSKEEVLDGISRIAYQNKIKIDQMIPGKGMQEVLQKDLEEQYYAFPISVEVHGGYHDIGRFVDQLEKDNVYKSIAALTIESNAKDPTQHTVRLMIKTILLDKIEKSENPKGS